MKIEDSKKLFKDIIAKMEEDNDAYFLVHFSREDDKFDGTHGNMDFADALILVKQLMREFHINPAAISLIANSVKN